MRGRLVPLDTDSHVPMEGEPSFAKVIDEIEAFVAGTSGQHWGSGQSMKSP